MRYRRNKGPVAKKIWIDSASSFRQTEHSLCRRKNTMRISIALLALFAPAAAISAANSTTPVKPGRIHGPAIIHQRHGHQVSSTNWSGYAITGAKGSVSDVRASWVVPSIVGQCPSTDQYSSFWVGIDGYSSNTVEQIGTDSDCQNVFMANSKSWPKSGACRVLISLP